MFVFFQLPTSILMELLGNGHSPRSRSIERNRRATEGNKVHKRYQTNASASSTSSFQVAPKQMACFESVQSSRRSSSSSRGRTSSNEFGSGSEKSQLLRRSASSDRASVSTRASTSGVSSLGAASNSARSSPMAPCSYDPGRERPPPRITPASAPRQQHNGRHFYAHFSEEDRRRYDQ